MLYCSQLPRARVQPSHPFAFQLLWHYLEIMELEWDWLEEVVAALSWENPLWLDSRLVIDPLQKKKEESSFKLQNMWIFWFLLCIYTVFVCTLNKKQAAALVQILKSFSASPHKIMRTLHPFQKPDAVQRDGDLISVKFIHWQKMKFNNWNLNCTPFYRTTCQAQQALKAEPSDQWWLPGVNWLTPFIHYLPSVQLFKALTIYLYLSEVDSDNNQK